MITWLIGLSGAGKSTIAARLYEHLKTHHANLVLLDGDAFREIFRNDLDHTIEGRYKNAERISHMCRVLDSQNIHVIASVLSLFPEWQAWNRETFSEYFETFLDIPLKTLKLRDRKGLYKAFEEGKTVNVVGMDIPFPRPPAPDLIIDEALQERGTEACVEQLLFEMPPMK